MSTKPKEEVVYPKLKIGKKIKTNEGIAKVVAVRENVAIVSLNNTNRVMKRSNNEIVASSDSKNVIKSHTSL
ncbi:MAG: hypothetical protein LBV67_00095 [Streptococcaceae bacterium]|jgi:preprotein translocase subunit YajC|nr:hypothetical protein [Streptococcaceae bacterium]